MEEIRAAAAAVREARRLVVFTGAGMSAESGIPTFRDQLTGLWQRFDPAALATPQAFRADPGLVWGWYEWRRTLVGRAEPNAGHHAIAALGELLPQCTVVTQNVDDLHERAGSTDMIHLHGSLFAPRCSGCGEAAPVCTGDEPDGGRHLPPPACAHCGEPIRPGVVWFGEALPHDAFDAAVEASAHCDVMLMIGTSGVVYPAAELPQVATRFGATVIQVNLQETPLDPYARHTLRGPAAQILPALASAM